jgi:hypothetical protein
MRYLSKLSVSVRKLYLLHQRSVQALSTPDPALHPFHALHLVSRLLETLCYTEIPRVDKNGRIWL